MIPFFLVALTPEEQKELDQKIQDLEYTNPFEYASKTTGVILRYHEDKYIERIMNQQGNEND